MIRRLEDINWRNIIVVMMGWIIVLWGVITAWASYLNHIGFLVGSNLSVNVLYGLHLILILAGLLFPIAAIVAGRKTKFIRRFQQDKTLYLALIVISLCLFYQSLLPFNRLTPLVGSITAFSSALIIWWLFLYREKLDLSVLVLVGVWGVASVSLAIILNKLVDNSLIQLIYRIGFSGLLSALMMLPFSLFFTRPQEALQKRLATIQNLPNTLFIAILMIGFLFQGVFWLLGDPGWLAPFLKLYTTIVVGATAILILKLQETPSSESEKKESEGRPTLWLSLILVVFVVLGIRLAYNWVGMITSDGFAYLQIAKRYAQGEFAVRGLWSPLISWILALPISLGLHPEVAARLLVVVNGIFWIGLSYLLGKNFKLSAKVRVAVVFAVALLVLKYSFWPVTPDFLAASILILYFWLVTHEGFIKRPILFGILTGIVGAFSYFAKSYNFVFFPASLILTALLLWLHGRNLKRVAAATSIALVAFGLIASLWIVQLSERYGEFTFSTAGTYNNAVMGREAKGMRWCGKRGLCDQPNDILFSWEDPDPSYFEDYTWSPLESVDALRLQATTVQVGFSDWLGKVIARLGLLPRLALVGMPLAILVYWRDTETRFRLSWLFLTIMLYVSGYMLGNSAEMRYYYPIFSLLVIAVYLFIQLGIEQIQRASHHLSPLQIRVLTLTLLLGPAFSLSLNHIGYVPPDINLFTSASRCNEIASEEIKEYLTPPIAGETRGIHRISYYTEVRSYGRPTGSSAEQVDQELREFEVTTFIAYSEQELSTDLKRDYGYERIAEVSYCDTLYEILIVPD